MFCGRLLSRTTIANTTVLSITNPIKLVPTVPNRLSSCKRFVATLTPEKITELLSQNEVHIDNKDAPLPACIRLIECNHLAANNPRLEALELDMLADYRNECSQYSNHSSGHHANITSNIKESFQRCDDDMSRGRQNTLLGSSRLDMQTLRHYSTRIEAPPPKQQKLVIDSRIKQYAKLSKIRLTGFVTSTVFTGGYIASQSFVDSLPLIATAALGTFLCSSSAAALNQFLETPYDSQMRRTAIRPLVVGQVSPLETVIFALVTGLSGVAILATCVNTLTAALGAANLLLYSFVYTPMKRSNVANTWIGSIVGAVPPIMGSTAVLGYVSIDAALLALILFSWQFPHFNALSWNLRHEYARAGYRMMSVVDPELCKRVALRHSGLLLFYTCALPFYGCTSSLFTLLALPLNLQFIKLSCHFYKEADSASSRKLFRFSLIYLPATLALLVITQPNGDKFSSKTVQASSDDIASLSR